MMNRTGIPGAVIFGLMVLMGFFSAGCSGIVRDFPEQNLFAIETPSPPRTADIRFGDKNGLLMRQFDIAAEFESSFFIYRVSANRFANDYYNKFMVSPARMISDAFREALYGSGHFRPVPASEPSDIDFRLSGRIIDLYADIQDPGQPRAVMSLRLILEQRTAAGFMPVINRVYEVSEAVPPDSPADLAAAWNVCLEKILAAFFTDAAALGPAPVDAIR
jgi:hypothetical protein